MSRALPAALAALAALLIAAPATMSAKEPPRYAQLKDLKPHTADPSSGYIYVRSERRVSLVLVAEPTPELREETQAERAEALAKAMRKYEARAARYPADLEQWRRVRRGAQPEMPVKPTLETVAVADAAFRTVVPISQTPPFVKPKDAGSGGHYGYLVRVRPGRYLIAGQIEVLPTTTGVCLCMGTLAFDVAPGVVTDLGVMNAPLGLSDEDVASDGRALTFAPAATPIPAVALAGMTASPATFRAGGKLPNWYGVAVDRVAPIPGVIAYDRDRVLDAAKGDKAVPDLLID